MAKKLYHVEVTSEITRAYLVKAEDEEEAKALITAGKGTLDTEEESTGEVTHIEETEE